MFQHRRGEGGRKLGGGWYAYESSLLIKKMGILFLVAYYVYIGHFVHIAAGLTRVVELLGGWTVRLGIV